MFKLNTVTWLSMWFVNEFQMISECIYLLQSFLLCIYNIVIKPVITASLLFYQLLVWTLQVKPVFIWLKNVGQSKKRVFFIFLNFLESIITQLEWVNVCLGYLGNSLYWYTFAEDAQSIKWIRNINHMVISFYHLMIRCFIWKIWSWY